MSDEGFIPGPNMDELDKPTQIEEPPDRRKLSNEEREAMGLPRVGRPKGPGRTESAPRRPKTSRAKKSLETEIYGLLFMFNLAFAFMPPEIQGDALDDVEMRALAKSANDAAMANEQLYRWLDFALRGGGPGMFQLALCVAMIGGRRLARHGLIPGEFDERLGLMLGASVGTATLDDLTNSMNG